MKTNLHLSPQQAACAPAFVSRLHSDKDYICLIARSAHTTSILVISRRHEGRQGVQAVRQ